jgi:hypothetical protein
VVYLTIMAPDVHKSDLKLDLQSTKLVFTGKSTTKNLTYHAEIEFFAEIDTDESKVNHTDRDIELVLRKKELKEEFWPRLLKDKAKVHWLKTDFDKVNHSVSVSFLSWFLTYSHSGSMRMSKRETERTKTTCPRWVEWEAWADPKAAPAVVDSKESTSPSSVLEAAEAQAECPTWPA